MRAYPATAVFAAALGLVGCKDTTSNKAGKAKQELAAAKKELGKAKPLIYRPSLKEIDQRLQATNNHLFDRHLLAVLDDIDIANFFGAKSGRGHIAHNLLSKRLTQEVFPVLHKKIALEGPDEVIVAEFTPLGEFHAGGDFGRGLRLVLRKEANGQNMSVIMFLDYNEKTNRLEFVQDTFSSPRVVIDAFRFLGEYDVPIPEDVARAAKEDPLDHFYLHAGMLGTTFSAELAPDSPRVVDLQINPTKDAFHKPLTDPKGQQIAGNASQFGCIGCHEPQRGFAGEFTSFEPIQKSLHLPKHQAQARTDFIRHVRETKFFKSPQHKRKTTDRLKRQLSNPKTYWRELMPTGFFDALEAKQKEMTHSSALLSRYNQSSVSSLK